jgi:hypothetical protein
MKIQAARNLTCSQYSERTLKGILRDLEKNPMSRRKGTWECNRLAAIKEELRFRGIK